MIDPALRSSGEPHGPYTPNKHRGLPSDRRHRGGARAAGVAALVASSPVAAATSMRPIPTSRPVDTASTPRPARSPCVWDPRLERGNPELRGRDVRRQLEAYATSRPFRLARSRSSCARSLAAITVSAMPLAPWAARRGAVIWSSLPTTDYFGPVSPHRRGWLAPFEVPQSRPGGLERVRSPMAPAVSATQAAHAGRPRGLEHVTGDFDSATTPSCPAPSRRVPPRSRVAARSSCDEPRDAAPQRTS